METKFNVGEVVQVVGTGDYQTEIVSIIYNKKRDGFYYASFDTDDGYARFSDASNFAKIVEEVVAEMTVEEISKALGKTVKVVK